MDYHFPLQLIKTILGIKDGIKVCKQYELLNGNITKRFVQLLAEGIDELSQLNYPSERVLVFISPMVQRENISRRFQGGGGTGGSGYLQINGKISS